MQLQEIESLIPLAKAGDTQAFERIYTELFTPVYRYCYIRTGHIQTAEDVAQNVFIKAFESLPEYKQNGKPVLSWLFTIARNSLTDLYRKNGSTQIEFFDETLLVSIADSAQIINPNTQVEFKEVTDPILLLAAKELEPDLYEIIQLKYIDGWQYQKIAHSVGKSESAIRQDVSRALRKLRTVLQDKKISRNI